MWQLKECVLRKLYQMRKVNDINVLIEASVAIYIVISMYWYIWYTNKFEPDSSN